MKQKDSLPDGVRKVPARPSIRFQIGPRNDFFGHQIFDGYVFEDDTSDLAKLMRFLCGDSAQQVQAELYLQKTFLP